MHVVAQVTQTCQAQKLIFQNAIKLFDYQNVGQTLRKFQHRILREGVWQANLHELIRRNEYALFISASLDHLQCFTHIRHAHAASNNTQNRIMRLFFATAHHGVERRRKRTARELGAYLGQALVDVVMRRKRASRENNPLGIAHETLFGHRARHCVVGHVEKRRCVADARGGTHDNRRVVALGKLERLLHHGKTLFGGRWIKHGHFREGRIATRVLLGLGRDGTGIIGHVQHHAALDTHVIHAHQRVTCHVHTHLLAGIQRARTCV